MHVKAKSCEHSLFRVLEALAKGTLIDVMSFKQIYHVFILIKVHFDAPLVMILPDSRAFFPATCIFKLFQYVYDLGRWLSQ